MSENASYGLTTWDESINIPSQNKNSGKRIPFIKMKEGDNIVRIITEPYACYKVKVVGSNSPKFGSRIKIAYPNVSEEKDPALKHGLRKIRRYYVGLIYKGTEDSPEEKLGLLEMGQGGLFKQLRTFKQNKKYPDSLRDFDINIVRDSNAGGSGYYTALPEPPFPNPLSESELALEAEHKEQLHNLLKLLSTPNTPEKVQELLDEVGWVPDVSEDSSSDSSSESSDMSTDDEDMYEFTPPAE